MLLKVTNTEYLTVSNAVILDSTYQLVSYGNAISVLF